MQRIILHLDLDAFFCAVETLLNPALDGKPFAVGGSADSRGVVASCSYAARVYGVRSAMPMGVARGLCPDLIAVPARHGVYGDYSRRVMAILHDLTPMVEQLSIDEAFLDVTGLPQTGEQVARTLQARIRDDVGLPSSLGVATSKLLAKTANTVGKARYRGSGQNPNAITVVPPGEEAAFLASLPIRELWGVGAKTAERLTAIGAETIGDIAQIPHRTLVERFGKLGDDLWKRANGLDTRPVVPEHDAKSLSKETTFTHDVNDGDELRRTLRYLAEGVGRRLRQKGLSGKTVFIKLRWSDFTTLSRQTTLPNPTQDDSDIYRVAADLFAANWPRGRPVRLIGVGVSNLEDAVRQLDLFEDEGHKRDRKLQSTLDDLRQRFGDSAIKRGSDFEPDH